MLTSELLTTALKIAGIGLLVYAPIAYFCFRGENDSHTVFLSFLVITIIGLPLFSVATLTTVNGFLDSSEAVWQEAESVDQQVDEGDYYVTVKASHNGKRGESEIEVTEEMYNQLQNQNTVMIKVKDGFLSEPWIKELKVSP